MKKINSVFLVSLILLFTTVSCSKDSVESEVGPGMVKVGFNIDATETSLSTSPSIRTFNPGPYTKDEISIHAFRKNAAGKFIYHGKLVTTAMAFTSNKLTGEHILPVGNYKFLITYGEGHSQFTFPTTYTVGTSELNENDAVTCSYSNQGLTSEMFLQTGRQTGGLKEYDFKVNASNDPVKETLRRTVARIDVLFVNAKKTGTNYEQLPYTGTQGDVLGDRALKLTFDIDELSNSMSVLGTPSNTAVVTPSNIVLDYKSTIDYSNINKVTIGSSSASSTVGTPSYTAYDNVLPADIILKGAHVFGTYLYPFVTDASPATRKTTDLTLTIEGRKSATDVLIRDVEVKDVPLEQNKVTLIIVYVMDGGQTVFETKVPFEVGIVTEWLAAHVVEVEVD